jgi:hypothetical protein
MYMYKYIYVYVCTYICMYVRTYVMHVCTKVTQVKIGNLYKSRAMKQLMIAVCLWTVICFSSSLSQQFEQNAAVCCLLACVCSLTTPNLIQPIIP